MDGGTTGETRFYRYWLAAVLFPLVISRSCWFAPSTIAEDTPATPARSPFADVPRDHWSYDALRQFSWTRTRMSWPS